MACHTVSPNMRESHEGNLGSKDGQLQQFTNKMKEVIKTAAIMNQVPIIHLVSYLSSTSDLQPSTGISNLSPGKSVLNKFKPY